MTNLTPLDKLERWVDLKQKGPCNRRRIPENKK
jgi:hypothetical protein